MRMRNKMITLSDEAYERAGDLPRKVSLSVIARWFIFCLTMPEKEFLKKRDSDPEGIKVRDYLRGKIERLTK